MERHQIARFIFFFSDFIFFLVHNVREGICKHKEHLVLVVQSSKVQDDSFRVRAYAKNMFVFFLLISRELKPILLKSVSSLNLCISVTCQSPSI